VSKFLQIQRLPRSSPLLDVRVFARIRNKVPEEFLEFFGEIRLLSGKAIERRAGDCGPC
jgi:hypothetical protein